MTDSDENQRTIAACEQCGALYAALEVSTGNFLPIGRRDGCQCGSTDFSPVDESFSDVSFGNDED